MAASTLPLSETQLALGEVVEMLAAGRSPEEVAAAGWEYAAGIMAHRRRLILQAEIDEAPPCFVDR